MYSEVEIVNSIKREDVKGMRMLFDNYYQALCIFALKYIDSFSDSEDIVQEIFISFWEKKKGDVFEGSLKSYLFGAVYKSCMNYLKNSGKLRFSDIEEHLNKLHDSFDLFNEEEIEERKKNLHNEIEKLPEKCREVFMAIVLDNLQYKEVAEKLNISLNTVKTHYSRALKQLRSNLDTIILILLSRIPS